MTTTGFDLHLARPAAHPASARTARSGRVRLLALVKLAVVGGLTFAVGLLGTVALRSLGLGAGLASIGGGLVVSASVAVAWYGFKIHNWLEVIDRLYTT